MRCEDYSMLKRIFYLFCVNTVLAFGFLLVVLIVGEYLIPNFATPFIDIVHGSLIVFLLCMVTVFFDAGIYSRQVPPALRILQNVILICAVLTVTYILWAKSMNGSSSDEILIASFVILSFIFLYSTFSVYE